MSELWDRWGALTRSMISLRVAAERERSFWDRLEFTNRSNLKIKASVRGGKFTLRLIDHVRALDDENALTSAALILSYALAEAAATDRLQLDQRRVFGIEDWGGKLLAAAGSSWDDVEGGLAGAVEVAVVRNLIVHGLGRVDHKSHARLAEAGCQRFAPGDPVTIDHDIVGTYRSRLRGLLTAGGLGTRV